jgi:hypothetical protein
MSKIQIPIAVSLPDTNGHPLEIAVVPGGDVFGKLNNGGRGRGNRYAMYGVYGKGHSHDEKAPVVEMPRTYIDKQGNTKAYQIVQTSLVEVDEEQLKAIVERGYKTDDEASLLNVLRKAWADAPMVSAIEDAGSWLTTLCSPRGRRSSRWLPQ